MTQGIHQLTASMVNQLNRVDVVSNNLANANTVGFKEDNLAEGSFNRYLRLKTEKDEAVMKESVIMNTIPKIDTGYVNDDHGSVRITGNQLDFALSDTNSFFKIQNAQGDIEYTRDGSFKSQNNQLVTQNNLLVLDGNNQPININNPEFAETIGLVTTDFKNLDKIGNNNYKAINTDEIAQLDLNGDSLVQGATEQSNVNTVLTMVELIAAQRKFEQSQKAITGIDAINTKVIDTIGNGR